MVKPVTQILIDTDSQLLSCLHNDEVIYRTSISTGLNGTGQRMGSEQTPLGKHRIRVKVGEGEPVNSVFIGRRPTGEIYSPELANAAPNRDWILTRIIWLSGQELGKNRKGDVDTLRRYIYLHGCPDSCPMGTPESHGCIRMRNADIIHLFNIVDVGCSVLIT